MEYKRAKKVIFTILIIFSLLLSRILYISCKNTGGCREIINSQQLKVKEAKKLRGKITDRSGIPFTDREKEEMSLLSDGTISKESKNAKFTFFAPRRFPLYATHVTGYTDSDGFGMSGIEKEYDAVLGNKGNFSVKYMADAGGGPVDSFETAEFKNKGQSEVRLTLDYHIQKITEEVMDKYIKSGAAVIIDIKTFEILSLVSRPDYDPSELERYFLSADGELLNRALMGYNAGSIFKIITACAALEKNPGCVLREFNCLGSFSPDGKTVFGCNSADGHGMLSFEDAFAKSCNCAYYVLGLETGAADILDTAKKFGIGGKQTGGILYENSGNLPQKEIYTAGDCLNLAIGQGEILVTPLQCAAAAATVANGGVRKNLRLISEITEGGKSMEIPDSDEEIRVITEGTANILKSMMRSCVLTGTGAAAKNSSSSVCGKTGSAETGWIKDKETMVHGWFCGFFPYDEPKYAMAILSENGKSGAESCVEPFYKIAEKINEIYPFLQ